MSSLPHNRRYSEEEIQAIFRRATERQETVGSNNPHRGLTLEELKEIGAESGIDPAHIEGAASDLERGALQNQSPTGVERFYGMPASIHAERVLPGTMDDDTWDEAVEVLQSVFKTRGHDQTVGPLREWSAFTSSGFDYQAWQSDDTWYTLLEGLNLTSNETQSPVHVETKSDGDGTRITASYQMPASRLWERPGILGGFWGAAFIIMLLYPFVSLPLAFLIVPLSLFLIGGGLGAINGTSIGPSSKRRGSGLTKPWSGSRTSRRLGPSRRRRLVPRRKSPHARSPPTRRRSIGSPPTTRPPQLDRDRDAESDRRAQASLEAPPRALIAT